MSAVQVAKAIGRIDDAMWLPRIASWEIAQTDGLWGAHGELAADSSVAAVMALTKLASEVGSELADKDRLFTVDFQHGDVPVRVWWLRPIIPVHNATAPVLLSELAQSEHELTGARLSLWEEEQDSRRLHLALKSARRGRAAARERIAELEKAACGCFPAEMHDAPCAQSLFVVDGVEYSAVHWYRDADGAWWIPVGGNPMRMLSTAGEEPVPLTEVISDYGPLTRTEYTSGDQPEEQCSRVVGDWGRCTRDWSHEGPHLYPTPTAKAGDVR